MRSILLTGALIGTLAVSSMTTFAADPASSQSGDVNLALGKSYTTSTPVPDSLFSYYEQAWFPHVDSVLTDGKLASPVFYEPDWSVNPNWQAFVLQDSRTVTVDLGQVDTVHQISQDFMNDPQDGVYLPEHVFFSVSNDGQNWKRVGDVTPPIPITTQAATSANYVQTNVHLQARYVRAQFPTTFYAFSDEIQVMGQPGVQAESDQSQKDTVDNTQNSADRGYATLAQSGGVNDILLAPLWLSSRYDQTKYPWNLTAQQWLPMIAYLDSQGNVKDWMFSSILACRGAGSSNQTQADWQTWIDHLFNLGAFSNPGNPTELPALDTAVGTAKAALKNPNYKENVIVTIPYPDPTQTSWGTLDGQTMNFTNEQDRQAAVAWFTQQVEQAWQKAGFQNLQLAGFYWESESVYDNQPGEVHLIRSTANMIHQMNQKFYWIPYFGSPGYKIWNQLGFDAAMLQPNYAFANVGQERLTETAELARHYGLGVELEFPNHILDPGNSKGTNTYLRYQDAGMAYQFQSGVPLAWYQGTQSVLVDSQHNRLIYDLIHQFLTGTYTPQSYQLMNGTYQLAPTQPNLPPMASLDIPFGLSQLQGNLFNDHENNGANGNVEPNSEESQYAHHKTPHQQDEQQMDNSN